MSKFLHHDADRDAADDDSAMTIPRRFPLKTAELKLLSIGTINILDCSYKQSDYGLHCLPFQLLLMAALFQC